MTLPRCCGWQISVKRTGEAICAILLPKPRTNLPATYTGKILAHCCINIHSFKVYSYAEFSRTSITIGKGSNKPAQDHQETTSCDWDFASPPIGHVRAMSQSVENVSNRLSEEGLHQRETAKTSDLIDSIHQSESITSWRSEIMLPGIKTLGGVKHHAVIERVC